MTVSERVILGPDCVAEGAAWLVQADPRFAPALAATGPLPLRLKPSGFPAVLDAIMGQQVSIASAAAIWARLSAAGLTEAKSVDRASEEDLRACGLSRQKIRYAKALAAADLPFGDMDQMATGDVIKTLVAVPGIGPWTAEIYAMFSLGRADVFAPGDLALQEAARVLFALEARPKEAEFRAMAEAWTPWRSVAARALWAYYRVIKEREGTR